MLIKSTDFSKHLAGTPRPVYILAGEEQFQLDETLDELEKALSVDTLNRETLHPPEASADDIIMATQTMPFLSDRRLVIVREAHKLKVSEAGKLALFIAHPSASACLVLLWNDRIPKEIKKSALFAAAEKSGMVVDFKKMYERELPAWVQKRAAFIGKRMGMDAVNHLLAESGPGLLDLAGEIEKLALYVGKKPEITAEDVEKAGGHTRHSDLNAFRNALETRDTALSLKTAESLLKDGEPALKMLAVIYNFVRRFIIAKSLMEQKKSSRMEIQQELRVHSFFARDFFDHCALFQKKELEKGLKLILSADAELKRSARPDAEVIGELVSALCRK